MPSLTEHPLLDQMVGRVMRGTSVCRSVVHDVEADWVLAHHYIRIHEVSREKNTEGQPVYEAMVFIGWTVRDITHCVWLNILGGLSTLPIGVAIPGENELPFVFRNEKGEINLTNTFTISPRDEWEWKIDNVENGLPREFARLRLTVAKSNGQE